MDNKGLNWLTRPATFNEWTFCPAAVIDSSLRGVTQWPMSLPGLVNSCHWRPSHRDFLLWLIDFRRLNAGNSRVIKSIRPIMYYCCIYLFALSVVSVEYWLKMRSPDRMTRGRARGERYVSTKKRFPDDGGGKQHKKNWHVGKSDCSKLIKDCGN